MHAGPVACNMFYDAGTVFSILEIHRDRTILKIDEHV
jgi:hypothetical protein